MMRNNNTLTYTVCKSLPKNIIVHGFIIKFHKPKFILWQIRVNFIYKILIYIVVFLNLKLLFVCKFVHCTYNIHIQLFVQKKFEYK